MGSWSAARFITSLCTIGSWSNAQFVTSFFLYESEHVIIYKWMCVRYYERQVFNIKVETPQIFFCNSNHVNYIDVTNENP